MPRASREIDHMGRVLCPDCKEFKDPTQFYANKNTKLGISNKCKSCHKAYQRKYSANQRNRDKKYTLAEAALILQMQGKYEPPTGPDGELVDIELLPENVRPVAGFGLCEVRPLTQEEIDERIANTQHARDHRKIDGVALPAPDSKTLKEHQDKLAKMSDQKLRAAVATIASSSLNWDSPSNQWSLWMQAVWAEAKARGWVDG